jgi:hypothetical protein
MVTGTYGFTHECIYIHTYVYVLLLCLPVTSLKFFIFFVRFRQVLLVYPFVSLDVSTSRFLHLPLSSYAFLIFLSVGNNKKAFLAFRNNQKKRDRQKAGRRR